MNIQIKRAVEEAMKKQMPAQPEVQLSEGIKKKMSIGKSKGLDTETNDETQSKKKTKSAKKVTQNEEPVLKEVKLAPYEESQKPKKTLKKQQPAEHQKAPAHASVPHSAVAKSVAKSATKPLKQSQPKQSQPKQSKLPKMMNKAVKQQKSIDEDDFDKQMKEVEHVTSKIDTKLDASDKKIMNEQVHVKRGGNSQKPESIHKKSADQFVQKTAVPVQALTEKKHKKTSSEEQEMEMGPSEEAINQVTAATDKFDLDKATGGIEQQISKSSNILGGSDDMKDSDFSLAGGADFDKEMSVFAQEEKDALSTPLNRNEVSKMESGS